jgi:hypothetical protein
MKIEMNEYRVTKMPSEDVIESRISVGEYVEDIGVYQENKSQIAHILRLGKRILFSILKDVKSIDDVRKYWMC